MWNKWQFSTGSCSLYASWSLCYVCWQMRILLAVIVVIILTIIIGKSVVLLLSIHSFVSVCFFWHAPFCFLDGKWQIKVVAIYTTLFHHKYDMVVEKQAKTGIYFELLDFYSSSKYASILSVHPYAIGSILLYQLLAAVNHLRLHHRSCHCYISVYIC